MAGTLVAEAAGQRATLSDDVVVHEAVEAETHQLRRDGAVALGCCLPRVALEVTTLDSLETIGVDVGPLVGLPRRVRHGSPTAQAKVLVHQDPCRRLQTKVTLRGHSCNQRRRSPMAIERAGPTPMTLPSLSRHWVGSLHGGYACRGQSLCRRRSRGPESLASSVQV
jgi:hypothetical protein